MTSDIRPAILIDANLLWAHHCHFDQHAQARSWLATVMSSTPSVGIAWPTILAFLRISSHPRALTDPLSISTAWHVVSGWLDRPNVHVVVPAERHRMLLGEMLTAGKASADHTSDAHLAALATESGLELASCDRDFARYPGLHWFDPLS